MVRHTDVAVIGSGFSAVALSLNLLDVLPPTAQVSLVGPTERQGRGVAYSTRLDCHLLNVPAGRMSLYADRPDHFVRWLAENGHAGGSDDFLPRRLYGRYVSACLHAALRRTANRAALTRVDAEALDAEAGDDGRLVLKLSDGQMLSSRAAALCTGAGVARLPLAADAVGEEARPFIVHDPWADAWWERLPEKTDVLFIGTGLTMIDQCLTLMQRGFGGTMHAVSRHGLLPRAHLARRAEPVEPEIAAGGDLSAMLAALRVQAEVAGDWRAVMDGLRPVTQCFWKAMSGAQRARFLRHAAAFWNVHRHRMAPAVALEIESLLQSGQLVIHRGRLSAIRAGQSGLAVEVDGRSGPLAVGMVVNCTGFERCSIAASRLLADLAAKGIVKSDPNGLGLAVDEESAVLAADGRANPDLYALGPLTAGRHWEITAVPDIRNQARSVAGAIGARFSAV